MVSYKSLPPNHHAMVVLLDNITEPSTYKEAAHKPEWVQAMEKDIAALLQNDIWEVVALPLGNHWLQMGIQS